MDEFSTSWNVLSRLHTEIFQRLLRKDAQKFTTYVRMVLYNCFSEFYHLMAFYLGLMGKVKRKRESTDKRGGG